MTGSAFQFDGLLPVFPLPNLVFFPRTVLPLHVFEPRYRQMVRDASAGDNFLAVSLLRPGWEPDYAGSPACHDIATLGRIEELTTLPDGRFNLKLVGLARVRLGEIVRATPYRLVRARSFPPTLVDESAAAVVEAKCRLLAGHACLLRALVDEAGPAAAVDEEMSFEAAINGACANLPVEAEARQQLLELGDLFERERALSTLLDSLLERVLRLKALRGEDAASYLN